MIGAEDQPAARPLIAVPTQTLQAMDDIPEQLPLSWVMSHRYFTALTHVGGAPFMVPLLDTDEAALRRLFDAADGVFLAGGVDVDPSSYGDELSEECGRTDPSRDRVELLFARWALAEAKPLLGVCRGMQILNVLAGGTLHQDCTRYFAGAIKHDYFPTAGHARDYLAHEIEILDGTTLRSVYGQARARVNSMHHQGIRDLGAGLIASALAPDGLIEAVEVPGDVFQLGVQWHPEMLIERDAPTRRLFESFVEAAAGPQSRRMLRIS
jgi:putative glutamine amidotransferase